MQGKICFNTLTDHRQALTDCRVKPSYDEHLPKGATCVRILEANAKSMATYFNGAPSESASASNEKPSCSAEGSYLGGSSTLKNRMTNLQISSHFLYFQCTRTHLSVKISNPHVRTQAQTGKLINESTKCGSLFRESLGRRHLANYGILMAHIWVKLVIIRSMCMSPIR